MGTNLWYIINVKLTCYPFKSTSPKDWYEIMWHACAVGAMGIFWEDVRGWGKVQGTEMLAHQKRFIWDVRKEQQGSKATKEKLTFWENSWIKLTESCLIKHSSSLKLKLKHGRINWTEIWNNSNIGLCGGFSCRIKESWTKTKNIGRTTKDIAAKGIATKGIATKGIATKGIGYKRFRQQKVSITPLPA